MYYLSVTTYHLPLIYVYIYIYTYHLPLTSDKVPLPSVRVSHFFINTVRVSQKDVFLCVCVGLFGQ